MTYRKREGSNVWIFCEACRKWPTDNYVETDKKPENAPICDVCKVRARPPDNFNFGNFNT